MPLYDLVFFDAGNRVIRQGSIVSPDDDAAIASARRLDKSVAAEVRQGARLIKRIEFQ